MQVVTRKEAKEQGLTRYFTNAPCKAGHVRERQTANGQCLECKRIAQLIAYEGSEDKLREIRRKSHAKCAGVTNARRRERYKANRPKHLQRQKSWRAANKDKGSRYIRERRASDPQFAMRSRLRARVHGAINAALASKAHPSQELLGCRWQKLLDHLEARFLPGMTWFNTTEWHRDEIRPCASFDLTDPEQQKVCFNWRNMQPLWAADNLAKKDRWTPEMEAEWVVMMREAGFEGELFLVFPEAA